VAVEAPYLKIVRTILAVLIAISLTLAPGMSAYAAMPDRADAQASAHGSAHHGMMHEATSADRMSGMDMSNCMKAMQDVPSDSSKSGCKCCDTKSSCPDQASCMAKCCKIIGALKPAGNVMTLTTMVYHQAEPAKPPEWAQTPPAPPPRT